MSPPTKKKALVFNNIWKITSLITGMLITRINMKRRKKKISSHKKELLSRETINKETTDLLMVCMIT